MKSIKTIALAASLIVAGSVVSNAQTRLHYTGSTAYRPAAINAIHNIFVSSSLAYAYTGSSETSANAAVYSGTIGTTSYIIKTYWSGSEAGIQAVAQGGVGIALNFPADSPSKGGPGNDQTLTVGTPISGIDDPTSGASGDYSSTVPNVDMADTYQATSQYHTAYQGHTYSALTGAFATGNSLGNGIVGVVPFKWVGSSGFTSGTNVTPDIVKNLFATGFIPKALFTGNTLDQNTNVYAVGRDTDSGTRLSAFSDTGYGALSGVFQFEPLASGSSGLSLVTAVSGTIAELIPWPQETVNGSTILSPDGGYNSGGKLAGAIGSNTASMVVYASGTAASATGTGGDLLTYLSTGDAATAIGGGGVEMTFEGVPYSLNALQQGQYGFWGYEHMYYLTLAGPVGTAGTQLNVVDAIATSLYTTYATVTVPSMAVRRSIDGAVITETY